MIKLTTENKSSSDVSKYCPIVGFDIFATQPRSLVLQLDFMVSADDAGEFVTHPEVRRVRTKKPPHIATPSIAETLLIDFGRGPRRSNFKTTKKLIKT